MCVCAYLWVCVFVYSLNFFVFYAVRVVRKESRRLVLRRTRYFYKYIIITTQTAYGTVLQRVC
jgi:hypothetical protein